MLLPLMMLVGCPKPNTGDAYTDKDLIGAWEDEEGARYIIDTVDGRASLVQATYSEAPLTVVDSQWMDGKFLWTVSVPSTATTVTQGIASVDGGSAVSSWTNGELEGTEYLTRVGAPYTAQDVSGSYVSPSGQLLVIKNMGGQPTVTSLVDYDGETLEVQSTEWDGYRVKWTTLVPSNGVVVQEWVDGVNGGNLVTSWENDGAEGTDSYSPQ